MLILLKLLVAVVAFFFRTFRRAGARDISAPVFTFEGERCYRLLHKNKSAVVATTFEVELPIRPVFKLCRESRVDKFFKTLGLSEEIQSGDAAFDDLIYIMSDSAAFSHEVRQDARTRELITSLFQEGARSVEADSKSLWIKGKGDLSANENIQRLAIQLKKQLADIDRHFVTSTFDPFVAKAVAIEALIWSLAAYAASGFFQWTITPEDVHLDQMALFRKGLWYGAGAAIILLVLVVALLRGSSRGHRVLVESALVLGLSLPIGGVGVVSDINTNFDKSQPVFVERTIYGTEKRKHTGRRGRTWYSYHLFLAPPEQEEVIPVPSNVQIPAEDFSVAYKGGRVRIEIGRGRLRLPWIRSLSYR